MDIPPALAAILDEYQPKPEAMFPGIRGVTEHLTRFMADIFYLMPASALA
ncbi:MAG: hypothetical protein V7K25_03320 [Nostoc sp.]